jgi:hypothetical protein
VGFGVALGWRKEADGEWMKGEAAAQIQIEGELHTKDQRERSEKDRERKERKD